MSYNSHLLEGVAVFSAVVEAGGFSAAARRLGHAPSHISKEVSKLEGRLGVQLLHRSTRSIGLTDEGRSYYERCKLIIETAQDAESEISEEQATPKGTLRVSAPVSFGLAHLRAVLPIFAKRYPALKLDVELNERMINIVDEGIDVAVRIGRLPDSSLVARKLTDFRGVIVAAPSYWEKNGKPSHPRELKSHDCISYSNMAKPSVWEFMDGSRKIKIDIKVAAQSNSAELETALAVAGVGVTRLPLFVCEKEVANGDLEIALEDFEQDRLGLYVVYPHRAYLPAKVRYFVDFLDESLRDQKSSFGLAQP